MTSQAAAQLPIPPLPPVENYGPAMARFALAAMRRAAPLNPDAPRMVMYLTPWYRQAAAWFAVALGIAAATRTGARIEFLINDLPYPAIHPFELNEIAALDAFCREFEAMFPSHRMSTFASAPAADRKTLIDGVVDEALRLDIRHRVGGGMLDRNHAASFKFSARTPLIHIASALDRFLAAERPDAVFCPGGVANGSYAVTQLTGIHNVRLASVDSNFGNLFLSSHSVAGQFTENAETYAHLLALPASLTEIARARGYASLAQKCRKAETHGAPLPPCDVLLPLGYDSDTVALGIGSLYESQNQWMQDTIAHLNRIHPEAHVVIRQHPDEAANPSSENVALMAELEQRRIPNLRIMRANESVPIYGLLQKAKACVACQSTVILEAQMLGIPGVSMRDTYYVVAGVTARPQTREAYLAWLDTQLSGQPSVIAQPDRDAAALIYFALHCSLMEMTQFTPHASDLWTWLHTNATVDLMSDTMADVARSLIADVPFATVKTRRALGLPPLPDGIADPVAA